MGHEERGRSNGMLGLSDFPTLPNSPAYLDARSPFALAALSMAGVGFCTCAQDSLYYKAYLRRGAQGDRTWAPRHLWFGLTRSANPQHLLGGLKSYSPESVTLCGTAMVNSSVSKAIMYNRDKFVPTGTRLIYDDVLGLAQDPTGSERRLVPGGPGRVSLDERFPQHEDRLHRLLLDLTRDIQPLVCTHADSDESSAEDETPQPRRRRQRRARDRRPQSRCAECKLLREQRAREQTLQDRVTVREVARLVAYGKSEGCSADAANHRRAVQQAEAAGKRQPRRPKANSLPDGIGPYLLAVTLFFYRQLSRVHPSPIPAGVLFLRRGSIGAIVASYLNFGFDTDTGRMALQATAIHMERGRAVAVTEAPLTDLDPPRLKPESLQPWSESSSSDQEDVLGMETDEFSSDTQADLHPSATLAERNRILAARRLRHRQARRRRAVGRQFWSRAGLYTTKLFEWAHSKGLTSIPESDVAARSFGQLARMADDAACALVSLDRAHFDWPVDHKADEPGTGRRPTNTGHRPQSLATPRVPPPPPKIRKRKPPTRPPKRAVVRKPATPKTKRRRPNPPAPPPPPPEPAEIPKRVLPTRTSSRIRSGKPVCYSQSGAASLALLTERDSDDSSAPPPSPDPSVCDQDSSSPDDDSDSDIPIQQVRRDLAQRAARAAALVTVDSDSEEPEEEDDGGSGVLV